MTAAPLGGDSVEVNVTAPATGRNWLSYGLKACVLDGAALTTDCTTAECMAAASAATTTCTIDGLEAKTAYGVAVVAEKAGAGTTPVASPASTLANATTPDHT